MTGDEQSLISEAFASNWIAPLGPHVDAFESEFAQVTGARRALALSSGTAALHLALQLSGVQRDDLVLASTFTFVGSINPIMYLGARPWFIDSEPASWNLDPAVLEDVLLQCERAGTMPRALVLVHLYGQTADLDPIRQLCDHHGVVLIEDAAEALGATYKGQAAGTIGAFGIYSFNGNKIITTSGGGMLVSSDGEAIEKARFLATQAREPAPHYQHEVVGYNYRMSNLLAAVGRAQLSRLQDFVRSRREIFQRYVSGLAEVPGIAFMPEAPWGRHTRWLTCITVDADAFGATAERLRLALDAANIEARPLWKPMHLQPVFEGLPFTGPGVAEALFRSGLCLPSGSALTVSQQDRVIDVIRSVHAAGAAPSRSALNAGSVA